MDKKELKWYETPASELIEVASEGFLCGSTNAENADVDPIEFDDDEG
jgi:hypothetical protein